MATGAMAQDIADGDSTGTKVIDGKQLSEVTVSARQSGRVKTSGLGNTEFISSKELLRAACCNLGESFTTNPSVDVNYADAATGAQQNQTVGPLGYLCADVDGKRTQLSRGGRSLRPQLHPWTLDAEHSGVEGCLFGEERLRKRKLPLTIWITTSRPTISFRRPFGQIQN